ncbi:MAG TPA: tetratricopeptide repeat protein [Bdellovibrionota bacterium]|nr:tetratricopeptide repeat protein [Bdellovibrionota bacterium]
MRHRILLAKASIFVALLSFGSACATSSTSSEKKPLTKSERARLLVEVANGALLEGDPIGALQDLAKAEAEDPKLPEIYHSKALAYHAKRDLKRALVEARHAVKLFPPYAEANNTLGKLLIDAGQYEEAVSPLLVAADNPLFRDAYKALTNLGILYYRRGQLEQSLSYLDRAIESEPQVACIAYYYRGHLRLKESRFKDAVRDYDLATRKYCGGFADAHLALGIAYEQNRQFDLARKKFLEVQQRYPDTKIAEQAMSHLRYLP